MNFYDFVVKTRSGEDFALSNLKDKVVLIVNTATGCGFTPQYEAIEKLYEKYHEQGFEVLDFPCNQFGHQAPGDNNEIHEFCTAKYKTQFDQLAKIDVNGENQSPLFAFIKKEVKKDEISGFKNKMVMNGIKKISKTATGDGDILWNFTKFLVDKNGNVVKRYSPIMDPMKMEDEIVKLLK